MCFTETWLNPNIADDDIKFSDYRPPFRRDRSDGPGGGICVYVTNNIYATRRTDLELNDIECIWIEVSLNNKKLLIGTFYRPPTSKPPTLKSIENSIGLACDTDINDILIVGDFNLDILKHASGNKINSICQQFNLHNLIQEPSHFTEIFSSIIDLVLTSNKNSVLLSGVGEPFLEQNIRYHCPVFVTLSLTKVHVNLSQYIFGYMIEEISMAYEMHFLNLTGQQYSITTLIFTLTKSPTSF